MYLIRVIPIRRKIPGGELSYLSKDMISVGTILEVPIKKSLEYAVVIAVDSVDNEKSYIKSLPWKLVSIENNASNIILQTEIINGLKEFSIYSMAPLDVLVRACLSEEVKKKVITKDSDTLCIVSSLIKEKKVSTSEYHTATFHTFLSFFTTNSKKLSHIILEDPEGLSKYGLLYLGFDPTACIVLLAQKLKISLTFSVYHGRLRYREWHIPEIKKTGPNTPNIRILSREDEPHTEKQFPVSKVIEEYVVKRFEENKRILIVGSAKSFAPKTLCGDCNTYHSCSVCMKPLRLVKNGQIYARKYGIAGEYLFVCTECNRGETALVKCRTCDSWNLLPVGYGIERIMEYIQKSIPKDRHDLIYDFSSSVSIKKLKTWQESGGIIIGSLPILNTIESCDVCIVPSLGALLYDPFFESGEEARDILTYGAKCDIGMIVSVLKHNEQDFLETPNAVWEETELSSRIELHYPPYARHMVATLDILASKSERIQYAIKKILNQYAIPSTITMNRAVNGQVTIQASFPLTEWSLVSENYELPRELTTALGPFFKYMQVEVY